MNLRLYIVTLSLLLLARPAAAESGLSFVWDLSVAPTSTAAPDFDAPCQANPYALYRRGCADDLNLAGGRPDRAQLSSLDQLLLLANRFKDLNLQSEIRSNTQLKFTMGLVNLYDQEAQARIELKIRF